MLNEINLNCDESMRWACFFVSTRLLKKQQPTVLYLHDSEGLKQTKSVDKHKNACNFLQNALFFFFKLMLFRQYFIL